MVEEGKDQAIKLFGKTIPLPEIAASGCGGGDDEMGCSSSATNTETEAIDAKADFEGDGTNSEALVVGEVSAGLTLPVTASSRTENPQAPSSESHSSTVQQPSNTEEEAENKSQLQQNAAPPDKALKKPDKILPCPRCKSMETKFCYFNNYNVNQPRHFCKNCQRYWTAGGTMRNVPVGAGRRKSKSSASHYRHVILSDQPLQGLGADVPNSVHCPALKSQNGTSLIAFGPDNPICDVTSILNLVENSSRIRSPDAKINPLITKGNGGVDAAAPYSLEGDNKAGPKDQILGGGPAESALVYPPQLACFPGATWPYTWNSTQWGSQLPNSGFGSSGFSVALYPPGPYWGCSGSWAIKWAPPLQSPPPNVSNSSSSPSPNSPMLGKHSRDGDILRSSSLGEAETPSSKDSSTASERCLWVPKTLRIDDPVEAAKSSIWTTLGIKNPRSDSVCGGGIFRACFSSKDGGKSGFVEATPRRSDANPASLLRSQTYNEAS